MASSKIRNCRYKPDPADSRLTGPKENSYPLPISLVSKDFDFITAKKRLEEKEKSNSAVSVQKTSEGPN